MASSFRFCFAVLIFITKVVAESDLFLPNDDITNTFPLPSAVGDDSISTDDLLSLAENQPVSKTNLGGDLFPAEEQPISNDDLLLAGNSLFGCSDNNNNKLKSRNAACSTNNDPIKIPDLPNLLNSIDEEAQPPSPVMTNEGDLLNAWEQFETYCQAYTTQPTLFTIPVCGPVSWIDRDYQAGAFYTQVRQSWLSEF